MSRRQPDMSGRVDHQSASLADHSLRWDQRHRLLARVQGDPALLDELALQRRAVELINGAPRDLAPSDLHHRVALLVDQANKRRPPVLRAALRLGPVVACLTAAILGVTLSSGGGAVFTLGDAIALTKDPVQLPVPLQSVEQGAASHSGWRPEGISVDRISGRIVTTVFYASRDGNTIGYAVVGGPPLDRREPSRAGRTASCIAI